MRTHRKLRQAGVVAELQVFEGLSHARYVFDPMAPETKEAFGEIVAFFDRNWRNDRGCEIRLTGVGGKRRAAEPHVMPVEFRTAREVPDAMTR